MTGLEALQSVQYEDYMMQFIEWVQKFDHLTMQNEDDVETKFVLPLFKHLGYPDSYRCGKYPLKVYNPGKQGRKPEVDQIYFSTDEVEDRESNTALVIVEAKEPQVVDLSDAEDQARFYAHHLKPLLLVITNGYRVKMLKTRRHQNDEVVFDGTVADMRNPEMARRLYEHLAFEVICRQKEQALNERRFEQYVLLEEALHQDPQLEDLIGEGDFVSFTLRQGRKIIASRPKVRIECTLPLALEGGKYKIEFSNITRRGLTIEVDHDDILKYFILCLNTLPDWGGRRFISRVEPDFFELELGQIRTLLSREEVSDLCACIDTVSQEYVNSIVECENILETWDYIPARLPGFSGYYLISVKSWLWTLMIRFAHEFDWGNGDSNWHIFERSGSTIRITNRRHDHAFLWPKIANGFWSVVPDEYVEILYEVPQEHFEFVEGVFGPWRQRVGPLEIWTARYTRKWLLEKFIPKVISYFSKEYKKFYSEKEPILIDHYNGDRSSLEDIDDIKRLGPYLEDVQSWLCRHLSRVILASDLQDFYKSFTDIVRRCDRESLNLNYIAEKLSAIRAKDGRDQNYTRDFSRLNISEKHRIVLRWLDEEIIRIQQVENEDSFSADLISRVFTAAVGDGRISCSQNEINAAKASLMPLWKRSRFEMCYIAPLWPIFPFR